MQQGLRTRLQVIHLQELLLLEQVAVEIAADKMYEEGRILDVPQDDARLGGNIRRQLDDLSCQVLDGTDRGIELLVVLDHRLFEHFDLSPEEGFLFRNLQEFKSLAPLNDHRGSSIRHLDEFDHLRDRTHLYQVVYARILHIGVLLRQNTYQFIALVGFVDRLDRFIPAHRDRDHDTGKQYRIPQGQHRQVFRDLDLIHAVSFPFVQRNDRHEVHVIVRHMKRSVQTHSFPH